MIEMIQKRTMICGSGQPIFSKWWWIGAIRKMRLPRQLERRRPATITDSASTTKMPPTTSEQQLVLGERARPCRAPPPSGERADVAHEHLRRVGVEPEEAEARRRRARRRRPRARPRRRRTGSARYSASCRRRARRRTRRSAYVPAAIITGPIASPSRPSVRFTAFDAPTTTSAANGTYDQAEVDRDVLEERRTVIERVG